MKKILCFLFLFNILFGVEKYIDANKIKEIKKIRIKEAEKEKIDTVVETYLIKNLKANELISSLNKLYNVELKVVGNELILIGNKNDVENMKKLLLKIDKKKRQILISANIVETSHNLFERIGLNWRLNNYEKKSNTELADIFSLTKLLNIGDNILGLDIDALKENGDILIKTIPSILILDNEEGELKIINEVVLQNLAKSKPYLYEAGIIFKIKPKIIIRGYKEFVELEIYAELSNFNLNMKNKNGKQRNIYKSKISVENNKSIYIGGLKQESNKKSENKIPVLGEIPLFDIFFKKTNKNIEKRDLYIELQVKIIDD